MRIIKTIVVRVMNLTLVIGVLGLVGLSLSMQAGDAVKNIEKKITHIQNLDIVSSQPGLPKSLLGVFAQTGPYPPLNILILGSDTRVGQGSGFGDVAGARSDTIMLFHVNAARTQALEISFPRDLWVPLPGCASTGGSNNKINSAFAFGGASCTTKLISNLTGLNVDHVVIVDFKGFEGVVNAIGGLNVCLAHPINDTKSQAFLPAGQQKLNGKQALALARTRYSLADGSDLERVKRQQALVKLAIKQVDSSAIFTNPKRLYDIISASASSLSVDPTLTKLPALAGLAWQMKNIPIGKIQTITVPYYRDSFGHYLINSSLTTPLFQSLMNDSWMIPSSPSKPVAPTSPASSSLPSKLVAQVPPTPSSNPASGYIPMTSATPQPVKTIDPNVQPGKCYPPLF